APPGLVEHDLGGRFVMPGFVDAHVHVIPGGLSLGQVDLRGARSRAELQRRVGEVAAGLAAGEWVLGGQWDEGEWGGELPSAQWLDEVTGGRPAYLTRHDLHLALANSAALALAGLGPEAPDPEGGTIDRDVHGQPTGLLRESAMQRVAAFVPEPSAPARRAALAAATRLALSRGEVYMPAADAGDLAARVFTRRLAAWVAAHGRAHPGGRLFWGGLKEFADGSLGSRTALLWEPYSDAPQGGGAGAAEAAGDPLQCGQRAMGQQELRELVEAAVGAGLQVAIHAIGDRAVDEVVGAYQAALEAAAGAAEGPRPRAGATSPWVLGDRLRLRIEHAQHVSGNSNVSAAMAASGLTPVPNPLHLLADRAMLPARLGPRRRPRAFPFRSLLAAGARPAMASDWPVVDMQPLVSIYAAVHRHAPPPRVVAAMNRALPPGQLLEVVGAGHHGGTLAGGEGGRGEGSGAESGPEDGCAAAAPPQGVADAAGDGELYGAEGEPYGGEAERMPLDAAMLGHTVWGARAAGLEGYVGSLAPGRRADFVELSGPLEGAERLRRCLPVVLRTWVDGRVAYELRAEGRAEGGGEVPLAEAMLVRDGGIVAAPPGLVEHDLGGRFVMPGFVDAHVHVIPGGLSLGQVDLRGARSRAELQRRVGEVAAGLAAGEWVLGGQWDEGEWGGELPSAQWLDEVTGGRPAYLTRHDLHLALANSAALALAGLGPEAPDPEGGTIDRDVHGQPTGLLRESAMQRVAAFVPEPSAPARRAALAAATRLALSRGVTTLLDMGRYPMADEGSSWRDLEASEVYMPAADAGDLAARVFTYMPLRS
ncbi:putative amidohydrolase ytcJ, partial [Tetrabaena socialis]